MKSRFTGILTLFMAFMIQFSFAQEKTITGTVTDADDGLPLPGASVVIDGTTKGTSTDLNGKYSIVANQGDKLVFSFVEKASQTITVGASNTIDISLVGNVIEAVKIDLGYGKTTKEAYVGTATKISGETLKAKTVSNITQALKGEVAGVNVISGSGQPGSVATIRIRGFGSVNGNRDPLYVVDGIPYSGSIAAINPNDIESTTILKDATATAVYGSRGANGVVLITTKLGRSGATVIQTDFRTSINMSLLPRYDVIKSPEEYIEVAWNAKYNRGVSTGASNPAAYANSTLFGDGGIQPRYNIWDVSSVSELIDPVTGKVRDGVQRRYNPENWEDYGFRTAYRQEANVSLSGGTDKTQYMSSFGYVGDEGFIVNSDYKRYSTRLNLVHTPKDWLKAGANIGYSASTSTTNGQSADSGSIFWFVDNIPSIYPLFTRDEFGNKIEDPIYGGWQYDYGELGSTGDRGFGGKTNSIADAYYDMDRTFNHEFNGNFFFDVKLYKGLTFEVKYGAQYLDRDANSRSNAFYGSMAGQFGSLSKQRIRMTNQNFLQLLRYTKNFGDHGLEAFAAHESTTYNYNNFYATKTKAILHNTFDLDQYTTMVGKPGSYTLKTTLESYFGQVSYNYNQKYFLMGSVRRDGSSRFRYDKWGTFGSVGAGWIVSKESFMDNVSFVDYLKLKASYGLVGDQGNTINNGYSIYSIGNTDDYSFTLDTDTEPNEGLTWEKSKIAQIGLEATLFNNFLDVNVDYYRKNTDDLLFYQQLPASTGATGMWVNSGQLRNSGLEFDVLARLIKPKEAEGFGLSIGINGEFLKNEITEMPTDPGTGLPKVLDGAYAQGYSIFDFYMREWAGVDPATGTGLWNMYYDDINANGVLDAGDVTILSMAHYMHENPDANVQKTTTSVYGDATQRHVGKNSIPKVRGAFRLNMEYKNFDFTTQFSYSIGGYAYDNTYATLMGNQTVGGNNWHKDIQNRWQQPGDITNVPRVSDNLDANVSSVSTRFLTKADYLALNNVRLGYTFPQRFVDKSGLSSLNIYVSGDNLMFFSRRDGFNTSLSESGNTNTYRYTPLSSVSMGLTVQF